MITKCLSTFLSNKVYHYQVMIENLSSLSLNKAYDVSKIIHFLFESNQKDREAQFNLGVIYYEGKYVTRNIDKAIHYFSLAANHNIAEALFKLGLIYSEGKYVTSDIYKAIHYFSLAANQNNPDAQFFLGCIYYFPVEIQQDIKKGRYYIMLASKNRNRIANFMHGFLLHEGKNLERNIEEAIHYYKEASSFNIPYAKNNLGVIYRHGYGKIEGRAWNAIVYFEEAIRQKNDYLSMYNLAHIHIYDETIKQDINKSIEPLIRSSNVFSHSFTLLCIALVKQSGFNIDQIQQEIIKRTKESSELSTRVIQTICEKDLFEKSNYEMWFELYRNREFLYNTNLKALLLSDLEQVNKPVISKYPNAKDISEIFFEGFGKDIISCW